MKKVLMGNFAASHGVRLSRAQVISAYPITPQTHVVEELSAMVARGDLNAKFIKVESEHSALACCIAASVMGARAFTATSSHGLLLMHELLHWAAGGRLPIVMVAVNRAIAPGWNIWNEQTDTLSQRDTGWIQLYCASNQEILDTVIQAFKLAELVKIPVMVIYDAFILSHTYEPVDIPDQKVVDKFLPPINNPEALKVGEARAFGSVTNPDFHMEFRLKLHDTYERAMEKFSEIGDQGRPSQAEDVPTLSRRGVEGGAKAGEEDPGLGPEPVARDRGNLCPGAPRGPEGRQAARLGVCSRPWGTGYYPRVD